MKRSSRMISSRREIERKSPTEAADIEEIVRGIMAIQAQAAQTENGRFRAARTRRASACARSSRCFDLRQAPGDSAFARRLAQGIFAVPGKYPATVRFANADGGHRQDRLADVRAMSFSIDATAAALPGVTRLDFSMNTATTFPINDAHAFAVAVRVLSARGLRAKWKAFRSLTRSDFGSLLRTMRLGGKQKRGTPRLPYQQLRYLEHGAIPPRSSRRHQVFGDSGHNPARPLQPGPNRLQDELVRHVNEDTQMSEFAFALQFLEPSRMTYRGQTQEPAFWVENADIEWNERESPFHVVARLRLLPKSVLPPAESETFSIDVTEHSTPESRPIGSINRARWHAESKSRAARLAQPVAASAWTPAERRPNLVWTAMGIAATGVRRGARLGALARHERSSRAAAISADAARHKWTHR